MRRTRLRTAARRVMAAVPVVLAAMALASGPGAEVARADEGESITSFASTIDVDTRGDLHVTETIEYAFAGTSHHGLQRELRTRVDEPGSDTDRLYPVSDVTTSSPTGAPAQATVTDTGAAPWCGWATPSGPSPAGRPTSCTTPSTAPSTSSWVPRQTARTARLAALRPAALERDRGRVGRPDRSGVGTGHRSATGVRRGGASAAV